MKMAVAGHRNGHRVGLAGAVLAGLLVTASPGLGASFLVDFGRHDGGVNGDATASPDAPYGHYWNNLNCNNGNLVTNGTTLLNLTNVAGGVSSLGILISSGGWAANGKFNGGLCAANGMAPSTTYLGWFGVETATEDYFYTTASGSSNDAFKVTGLNTNLGYRLRIFGSRLQNGGTTDTRYSVYSPLGSAGSTNMVLQTTGYHIGHDGAYNGNDSNTVTATAVIPDASGVIEIRVTSTNLGSQAFAYVGALEIDEPPTPGFSSVTQPSAISYGTATVTLTGVVSSAGPVYPANGEVVRVTIDSVTSNAVVSGGAGVFSVTFPTASLTAGTHTVTYVYPGDLNLNTATNTSTSLVVNKLTPAIGSVIAAPSVAVGAASVTLTGVVSAAGPYYAQNGETVAVTINGVTSNATVAGGGGVFSVTFPTASLPYGTYPISYAYAGGVNFNAAAANTGTSLDVSKGTPVIGSIIAAPGVVVGAASVTLTGVVSAAGPTYPANGETVAVTINGVTSNALVAGGSGGFSVTFPVASLPVGVYGITYSYGGNASLFAAAANSASSLTVAPAVFLVDFGPTNGTDGASVSSDGVSVRGQDFHGSWWNSWQAAGNGSAVPQGLSLANLVTTNNVASSVSLQVTNANFMSNGFKNGGLTNSSIAYLPAPFNVTNAAGDYFYTASAGEFMITGLNTNFAYDVKCFGCREQPAGSPGDTRFTTYGVIGASGVTNTVQVETTGPAIGGGGYNGNNTNIATIMAVSPDGTGSLRVRVVCSSGAYAYINAMELVGHSAVNLGSVVAAPSVAYGSASVVLTGVVSAAGGGYPADGEVVTITINGVSTNALIAGGAGAFSLGFRTAGFGAGTYGISYSYAGNGGLGGATHTSTSLSVAKAVPSLSLLAASATIVYGTSSITLTGVVSAGGSLFPPNGEGVTVTINGVSTNAMLAGGAGAFSVNFPVASLPVAAPYAITYAYAGDANFAGANDATRLLTVTPATSSLAAVTASSTILQGMGSITLTGAVTAGTAGYPANGETVAVTLNGVTSNAVIAGGAGAFSVVMPSSVLTAAGSPYPVSYIYPGNANLYASTNTATAVTVIQLTSIPLNSALAVASSSENGGTAAANAFDGNNATRWGSSFADNQWIYIDLGADYRLSTLALDWETACSRDYTIRVRTSAQGVDSPVTPSAWTQVASVTGRSGVNGSGGSVDDVISFSNGTFTAVNGTCTGASVSLSPKARYLMIYGSTRATVYGHSLWEAVVGGQGIGGTVGVQLQSASNAVNLTATGGTDWHAWVGASGAPRTLAPAEQKSSATAVRSGLSVTYTLDPVAGPTTWSWSDGTPDAAGTTNRMTRLRQASPSQASFAVDLVHGLGGEIRVWFGCMALLSSRTVTLTASYPDGTAATQSFTVNVNDTQYREGVISFFPQDDTVMTVTIATSGESELYVGAVAVSWRPAGSVYSVR